MSIHGRCTVGASLMVVLLAMAPRSPGQDAAAETDPELAALDARVRQFFDGVALNQTAAVYQELLRGSRLDKPDKAKARTALVEKTDKLTAKYGRYLGAEQIAAQRVGGDLVLLRYLFKCEEFPLVWYFTFYRTPSAAPGDAGTWRVVTVRFDTELELLGFQP